MISTKYKLPIYVKASILLIGIYVMISMLYITQDIIVPLVFALIISILLNPVVNFFNKKKVNNLLSITITLILFGIAFLGLMVFLVWQISGFSESWPIFVEKFSSMTDQTIATFSNYFDIDPKYIYDWLSKSRKDLIDNNGMLIGQKIFSLGSSLLSLVLLPVYIFFILYYKTLLLEFVYRLFAEDYKEKLHEIITEIKTVVQRYLSGLIIQLVIIAILNSVGLLIIGIDYAILLGVLGALLNLIPYIGGIVAVALPMMIAFATKTTPWPAVYVLALYAFVQMVDNNYIVPKIVASKVQINALFSIIVVLLGNALWGVSGMFLSIPLLAIMKLIFDRIEPLKPWGFLLGDTMPNMLKLKPISRKKKAKPPIE